MIDVTTQKINLHISAGTGLETAEAGFKKVAAVFPESLIFPSHCSISVYLNKTAYI